MGPFGEAAEDGQRPVRVLSDAHLRDTASHADDPALVDLLLGLAALPPGCVILNGDFFDFVKVTATPRAPDHFDRTVTAGERLFGLDTGEERSAWKATRILDANPEVVSALRALVERGHELVFLPGNHDMELAYPAVRREVAARIDPARRGRIRFSEWFYYEPGRLYVEHGSHYDRENSIAEAAAPAGPRGAERIAMPFGIVSSRFFANSIERRCGLPPSDLGPGRYFLWVFRHHGAGALLAIARYFFFACVCLARSGPLSGGGDDRRRREAHLAALKSAAERSGMDLAAAFRLDALRVEPLLASSLATLMRLYVPQVSLAVLFWGSALVLPAAAPALWWISPVLVLVSIATLALSGRLYTGRIREDLEAAAGSIGEILRVPCVVFGHDHGGLLSAVAPGNFVSSVWRFYAGSPRFVEIPAGAREPRVVSPGPRRTKENR